jgi:hypothetical protein
MRKAVETALRQSSSDTGLKAGVNISRQRRAFGTNP